MWFYEQEDLKIHLLKESTIQIKTNYTKRYMEPHF